MMVFAPYSRTDLMLELNILSLICVEMCFEFHTAVLAFPILASMSLSLPPLDSDWDVLKLNRPTNRCDLHFFFYLLFYTNYFHCLFLSVASVYDCL